MPDRLEIRTLVSHVRHGGRDVRVLRPQSTASRLTLAVTDTRWCTDCYADRSAIGQLAAAWSLAAISPRSIIYIPSRRNASPAPGRPVDLVLMHAALQFRASQWKTVRSRLGPGTPHTAHPPDPGTDLSAVDFERIRHREYRDLLHFDNAADTLFVSGGPESFRRAAIRLRMLLLRTTERTSRGITHLCAEIDSEMWPIRTRHGTPGLLHIQYEPTNW